MSLMVSISGVRGIVGESLTPEIVKRFALSFAEYCNYGLIIIGRDGRPSGNEITKLASEILSGAGCKIIDIGITPTPTIQLAVEKFHATGGIAITASHNPAEWNGLKFLNSEGMFLNNFEQKQFLNIYQNISGRSFISSSKNISFDKSLIDFHIQKVISLPYFKNANFTKKIKVVVDTVNASGSFIIPKLLKHFNCEIITIACDGTGIFPHMPEPIPKNLTQLSEAVILNKADLGIAIDPDADRLVLFTEEGIPFSEEYTVVAVSDFVLKKEFEIGNKHRVVTNLSTTRAMDDISRKYGATLYRTPVGEINVATKMKEVNAIIGGEGSGGVILKQLHLGRDAMVGIGLILQSLAEFGGKISELKKSLPNYFILKDSVDVSNYSTEQLLDNFKKHFNSRGKINTDDGIKFDFENSWCHLRKSNTEPIIRIITEAQTFNDSKTLLDEIKQFLQ